MVLEAVSSPPQPRPNQDGNRLHRWVSRPVCGRAIGIEQFAATHGEFKIELLEDHERLRSRTLGRFLSVARPPANKV